MVHEKRSRFVVANGIKTHYTECGDDGPVLVGLHGGGAGSSGEAGFGRIMPFLAEAGYRVIGVDSVGGYGLTDVDAPAPLGIQSRVDHLEAVVDALCLDKFSITGNSQGAWGAARYATLHPDRIDRIVLVASGTIHKAMGFTYPVTEGNRILQSYDGTREAMRRLLQALIIDQNKITDDLIDARQAAASRPGAAEARKRFQEGTRFFTSDPAMSINFDERDSLPRLTKVIPTIFLWGEDDKFAPPEQGQDLVPVLPDVKFHWIPQAGHQAQNDQPELCSQIIIDFLNASIAVTA